MVYEIDILNVCYFHNDDEWITSEQTKNCYFCSYIRLHLNEVLH